MSMKNFNDTIGNQTRDLPACRAVPQPTALPRASFIESTFTNYGSPCALYSNMALAGER